MLHSILFSPSPCVSGRFAQLPLLCGRVGGRSKRRGKAVFGTPTPSTQQQGVWKTRTTSTTTSTSDKLGEADRKERGRSRQEIQPQAQLRRFHRCHWLAGWHFISFAVCIWITCGFKSFWLPRKKLYASRPVWDGELKSGVGIIHSSPDVI